MLYVARQLGPDTPGVAILRVHEDRSLPVDIVWSAGKLSQQVEVEIRRSARFNDEAGISVGCDLICGWQVRLVPEK